MGTIAASVLIERYTQLAVAMGMTLRRELDANGTEKTHFYKDDMRVVCVTRRADMKRFTITCGRSGLSEMLWTTLPKHFLLRCDVTMLRLEGSTGVAFKRWCLICLAHLHWSCPAEICDTCMVARLALHKSDVSAVSSIWLWKHAQVALPVELKALIMTTLCAVFVVGATL